MEEVRVRLASAADAKEIADIYNHYVTGSSATFDEAPKSIEDRVAWLEAHGEGYPVFVAEKDYEVVGWGSISQFRERPAYRHTVELGIYLRQDQVGTGIGSILLDELITAAEKAGHHSLIGQVVSENQSSLRMLERAGFERVGYLPQVGRKFGRWLDLVILQRLLPVELDC